MSTTCTITGTVAAVRQRCNLNGALWAEVQLRDRTVLVFPKAYAWFQHLLVEGSAVAITARSDGKNLFAQEIRRS